ncbi:MAG: hypothetical protein HQK53_14850 [Oligoflexia bacterium]|nr:hypothetical protein [Oligoflexia bacterium]
MRNHSNEPASRFENFFSSQEMGKYHLDNIDELVELMTTIILEQASKERECDSNLLKFGKAADIMFQKLKELSGVSSDTNIMNKLSLLSNNMKVHIFYAHPMERWTKGLLKRMDDGIHYSKFYYEGRLPCHW